MVTIMPIVNAITGLPISLSGIGVRESLLEVLLKDLCNLPAAIGVSISVIGYSYFVLFGVIGGIIYLVCSGRDALPRDPALHVRTMLNYRPREYAEDKLSRR